MSKINDLIKKLCPNGVKYYQLSALEDNGIVLLGRGNVISKNDIKSNPGNYPVYSSSAIGNGEIGRYSKYMFEDIRISWSIDGGGRFFYRNDSKYSVTNVSGWIKVIDEKFIVTKYLYYVLTNEWRKKVFNYTIKAHPSIIRKEYNIPVPPIEVQKEIVQILDKFGELEAELEARKRQYEFWRGKLLENSKNKVKFGNIATILRGSSPRPIQNFITNDVNGIPWIKIGDTSPNDKYVFRTKEKINVEGSKKSRYVKSGDFILSNSMSFGRPYILKIDGCIHDGWLSISNFEDFYISDFLYHLLSSKTIQDMMKMKASIGTVMNLNADIVKSIELPVYTKLEQEKIIKVLDKFEKLTNDITEGIPAEIKLRRQQYEYYRNKLLSFERLS